MANEGDGFYAGKHAARPQGNGERPSAGQPASPYDSGYINTGGIPSTFGNRTDDDDSVYGSYPSSPYGHSPEVRRVKRRKHHSRRRAIGIGVGVVAVAGVATTAVAVPAWAMGPDGLIEGIKGKANALVQTLNDSVDAAKTGDFASMHTKALQASTQCADLQDSVSGFLWDIAQAVPVYGEDVKSARALIAVLAGVIDNALVPVSAALEPLSNGSFISGSGMSFQVDMAVLQAVIDAVNGALPSIRTCVSTVKGMGEMHVDSLQGMVTKAKEMLDGVDEKIDDITPIMTLIPGLLGANGEARAYLIVAQSPAEIRSTGGFPGTWCYLTAVDGLISLTHITGASVFQPWQRDNPLFITDEERAIFTDRITYIPGDVGFIPDFPRVCDLWSQYWERSTVAPVSAIIAIDPVMFQSVLPLVGGVTLSDGSYLDAGSAARFLMHDVYLTYANDPDAQDAIFVEAVDAILTTFSGHLGDVSMSALFDAVKVGVAGGHILAWSSNAAEQDFICELGADHTVTLDPARPELGVYLSDDTWAKRSWYLDLDVQVGDYVTAGDGTRRYPVQVELSNNISEAEMVLDNMYMDGGNHDMMSEDDIMTWMFMTMPAGGSIENLIYEGTVSFDISAYNGIQYVYGLTHTFIGQPVVATFTVVTPPEAKDVDLVVRTTPTCTALRV